MIKLHDYYVGVISEHYLNNPLDHVKLPERATDIL